MPEMKSLENRTKNLRINKNIALRKKMNNEKTKQFYAG